MSEEQYVKTTDGRYIAIGGEEHRAIQQAQRDIEATSLWPSFECSGCNRSLHIAARQKTKPDLCLFCSAKKAEVMV